MTRERAAEDRGRNRSRDQRTTGGQSREDRAIDNTRQRGDVSRSDTDRTRRDQAQQRRDEPARRGSLSLSDEQRTRISARFSDRIERMNVRPLSRSQISVSVGAIVPRSVHLYAVPNDIIAIYPEFRGHRFVLVEDEIVIIEPGSYRIVATLPLYGERAGSYTTGTAAAGSRIRLSQDDRRVIRTVVMREPSCRLEQRVDFFIIPLPRTVEICEFPEEVVSEVPEIRSYRYVVRGDEIVLVDPDERRVVEVID
jgi:hypothetical protein